MSKLSRRSLAAALPALAVPIAAAVTVPAHAEIEDAELRRLGDEVQAAYDALGAVLDEIHHPDQESEAWKLREGEAWDVLLRAIHGLCETPARTMRGLITKARIGEIDDVVVGRDIAPSIVADLLALAASS